MSEITKILTSRYKVLEEVWASCRCTGFEDGVSTVMSGGQERRCEGHARLPTIVNGEWASVRYLHDYANSREAKQAARWTMATQGGSKIIAYRCPHRKKWHAGHKVGSAR